MPNKYFTSATTLLPLVRARSSDVEAKFSTVEVGFDGVATDMAAQTSALVTASAAQSAATVAAQLAAVAAAGAITDAKISAAQLSAAISTVPADAGKVAMSDGAHITFQNAIPDFLLIAQGII